MALNFPNTPTDGQVYTDVSTGNRWAWDSANTCWKSTSAFTQSITIAASAPGSPVVGQLWWNQDYGRLLVYYNDGTSTQWVDASPSDYTSTQAFNQSNNSYAMANASFNMANGSYATANAAFVNASAAVVGVVPAYNTSNAAFAKANNALANTSGTVFGGSLLVSSNIRTNTIQGFGGTNYIVDGYPRMPGQVIEYLASPCDGSTITGASGSYTWPSVTTQQSDSYSYIDLTGSSISYTPPTGATRVTYRFHWASYWVSAHAISHNKFFIDGVEVLWARHSRSAQYHESRSEFEWTINIGGVGSTNTGRQATWTTAKIMKMQYRSYGSGDIMYQHGTVYWDGGGSNQFSMPHLSIIAIA
jgi:hypothetical protein